MVFVKYTGKRKYHFRYYRLTKNHPFLVVLVAEQKETDGTVLLSGFNLTRSITKVLQHPNKYLKLETNPNPTDDSDSFVCLDIVRDKDYSLFTSPIRGWEISEQDEMAIDEILKSKYPNM